MKKALSILVAIAFCLITTATASAKSWVSTKEGRTNCEVVKIKNSKALLVMQDGTRVTMPLAQVIAYSQEGKVFRKLDLYSKGEPSGRKEFMQLLSVREDFGLFRYYRFDAETPYYCYYVYQGDKLCYSMDESMPLSRILNLFQYFGVRAVVA
jgi:hypothetical protein